MVDICSMYLNFKSLSHLQDFLFFKLGCKRENFKLTLLCLIRCYFKGTELYAPYIQGLFADLFLFRKVKYMAEGGNLNLVETGVSNSDT